MNDGIRRSARRARGAWERGRGGVLAAILAASLAGCATVAPQQRAFLADPTMQFDAESKHEAALRHAIENREGSMGGTGVSGGGCGCN
ncbi:MAG: DUF4266 domain-containing protein [Myxococcales bacterium]|nr:DUF4266 domain-containing protein [Myxococcales bacterium]